MANSSLLTYCKSVLRGDANGDRLVAMIILNKAGVKVSRSIMDEIRSAETEDEVKLREANDVYGALQSFVYADRRGTLREVVLAANAILERYNKFEGKKVCTRFENEKSWSFGILANGIVIEEFVYNKNKYNAAAADALLTFFADHSGTPALLLRIYSAYKGFNP